MRDKLGLMDKAVPLQQRYDKYVLWLNTKNYPVSDFIAAELGLTVGEADVFAELGALDEEEFDIIDQKGFDIGHLFLIVRASKVTRNIIYQRSQEIINAMQPLNMMKRIVDENSNYIKVEELIRKVSAKCWSKLSSYLKQRGIEDGTINKGFRSMLVTANMKITKGELLSDKMVEWIVRAVHHDKSLALGVFTNDVIRLNFHDDYVILTQISESMSEYETGK